MLDDVQVAQRRLMIAELNQQAREWLGDGVRRMFDMGQWTGLLNKIDPDSVHCADDDREAQVWRDKAILYLRGYRDGLEPN